MRAVYGLGYSFFRNADDADDVAQETFVRAYQALDRYDARYTFYTWLRTIATRVALNEIAKRRRHKTEAGEAFETASETIAGENPDPIDALSEAELQTALQAALADVPPEYRAVLMLRTQDGLSYAEIAAILDIPTGTVMSRLHRARALVRRGLGRRGGFEPDREERR